MATQYIPELCTPNPGHIQHLLQLEEDGLLSDEGKETLASWNRKYTWETYWTVERSWHENIRHYYEENLSFKTKEEAEQNIIAANAGDYAPDFGKLLIGDHDEEHDLYDQRLFVCVKNVTALKDLKSLHTQQIE